MARDTTTTTRAITRTRIRALMENLAFIICFVLLFMFSIYIGFLIGEEGGARLLTNRGYGLANLGILVVCALATAFIPWPAMLYATPLGLATGALLGLKMGYGESVGPWKLLDRFFNVNRRHRETAQTGTGAAARRRRARTGEEEPDLISVAGSARDGADDARTASGKRAASRKRRER